MPFAPERAETRRFTSLPLCVMSKENTKKMGQKQCTLWKLNNFSVTQILREIDFCQIYRPKNVYLAVFTVQYFILDFGEFNIVKLKKITKIRFQSHYTLTLPNQTFYTFRIGSNYFHLKLSGRKIIKFPRYALCLLLRYMFYRFYVKYISKLIIPKLVL